MKDKLSFEQAMDRVEEIIGELSSGDATLEQSLELYSESAKLMSYCNSTLENAKLTIKEVFPEQSVEGDK